MKDENDKLGHTLRFTSVDKNRYPEFYRKICRSGYTLKQNYVGRVKRDLLEFYDEIVRETKSSDELRNKILSSELPETIDTYPSFILDLKTKEYLKDCIEETNLMLRGSLHDSFEKMLPEYQKKGFRGQMRKGEKSDAKRKEHVVYAHILGSLNAHCENSMEKSQSTLVPKMKEENKNYHILLSLGLDPQFFQDELIAVYKAYFEELCRFVTYQKYLFFIQEKAESDYPGILNDLGYHIQTVGETAAKTIELPNGAKAEYITYLPEEVDSAYPKNKVGKWCFDAVFLDEKEFDLNASEPKHMYDEIIRYINISAKTMAFKMFHDFVSLEAMKGKFKNKVPNRFTGLYCACHYMSAYAKIFDFLQDIKKSAGTKKQVRRIRIRCAKDFYKAYEIPPSTFHEKLKALREVFTNFEEIRSTVDNIYKN